ncbi:MAG: hypothetical protein ACRDBM_17875 [Sporomusa sp.]
MAAFIELARILPVDEGVVVPVNGTLVFDTIVSSDGTSISYDAGTGVITFNVAGFYYVDWYVAPQFGLTVDGSNWAIQTSISGLTFTGSSHTKVSVTTGFAIINAAVGETARLVNVSSGALTLSEAVQSKAALITYIIANL